ncbi:hypothetical protein Tsubulata_023608 [Turnera subulata]|uniref:DCD domain-containing protein n=1 Tax=Turnera subulata TaxID=218843 RepID=A0A9Q0JNG9_9ROSI|nr:hypothetical protein Tsubulata_023608 [Turnera subulata]
MEGEGNISDKLADENMAEPSTVSAGKNDEGGENGGEEFKVKQSAAKQKTSKLLKARPKVVKKSASAGAGAVAVASSSGKGKDVEGGQPARKRLRRRKNKAAVQGKEEGANSGNEDAEDGKPQEEKDVGNDEGIGNGEEKKENGERIAEEGAENGEEKQVTVLERIAGEDDGLNKRGSDDNKNNNNKLRRLGKDLRNKKNKGKVEAKGNNEKNKEKIEVKGKGQGDEKKKEKLGGLIFMCSAKTKPDCFRYRVMGVTMNKKDVVLSVKPGLKLFLYDFDLKLMYGIYEASSRGGIKLEPKAFGGSFPVQVRFKVYKDCFPIPESTFKKAIKENYDRKNKFSTELSVRQVRKLSELFRPATVQTIQPTAVPIHSPSRRDRERYEGIREPPVHSSREAYLRAEHEVRSLPVLSRDRHEHRDYQEAITRREEPRDLFMTEKEYRTYGLQGERRHLTPPKQITSALDPYHRDQDREHLIRQTDPIYRDVVPVHREAVYLNERDLQVYNRGTRDGLLAVTPPVSATAAVSRGTLDPYSRDVSYDYHYGSSSSAYLPPTRRDELSLDSYYTDGRSSYLVAADSLRRGETDQVNRSYSTYAPDSLSNYNEVRGYRVAHPETMPPPVSSRYSFAGPSATYR